VPGVERRLPAAHLTARELDLEPGVTQERPRIGDRVGQDEVADAGGEELDALAQAASR
jgi:hypothetical protein